MASKGKPLMFGDKTLDFEQLEAFDQIMEAGWDSAYIPGYSDKRRENEIRVKEGQKPIPLPLRFQWIRASTVNGKAVATTEMYNWARLGYRKATKDVLEENGYGMPPAAFVNPDGDIMKEDLVLAFVPEDIARRNQSRQNQINAEFQGFAAEDHIEVEERTDKRVNLTQFEDSD